MATWQSWLHNKGIRGHSTEESVIKPLWTIPLEPKGKITEAEVDEAILEWHKTVSAESETVLDIRTSNYLRNMDIYSGEHSGSRGMDNRMVSSNAEYGYNRTKLPEVVVNHSYELTEQWVAKLSRFSANVDVLPVNTEESDRNAAKASQRFADDLSEKNDFQGLMLKLIRDSKIGGESYIFVDWDEHKGDLHPSAASAKKRGKRVPLLGEDGEQLQSENGDLLYIDTEKRVGDLTYRLRSAPEVLLQPRKSYEDVEWAREVDLVDVDDLKAMYPEKSAAIEDVPTDQATYGTAESSNSIFVYTYWHKSTRALNAGRKIVLIDNGVLENDKNPFSGAPLPIVRLTDIDLKGRLYGWSFLNNILSLQLVINKLYTLWYKNTALGSCMYWLIPASARVGKSKIRNASSILEYQGSQKPEIVSFRTTSGDLMGLIDKAEERIVTISRIQTTSRGELPPNVEAGVAIGLLEEQENQAATPDVKKVNAAIEKLFKLSLGIAGDNYDESDGRTARILGKEGEFLLETLDIAKLSGPYDIKVKKATALSQSKPLMIQQITQLEAMKPGFFTEERLYDLMDLGDTDKFYEVATAALRTAQFENEQIREHEEVAEPEEGEYHLVHWKAHMIQRQSPSFKNGASDESKEASALHIEVTEMMLVEKAKENIALAQELMAEKYFPAFYIPDFTLTEIMMALQQGTPVPLMGEEEEELTPEVLMQEQMMAAEAAPDDLQGEAPLGGEDAALDEGAIPTEREDLSGQEQLL